MSRPVRLSDRLTFDRRGFLLGALAFGAGCATRAASSSPPPASTAAATPVDPAAATPVDPAAAAASGSAAAPVDPAVLRALAELENKHGGRLGIATLDVASGRRVEHRANERFPFCSTIKTLAAAATLKRVDLGQEQLDRVVRYTKADLIENSPVSKDNLARGAMTVAELCEATIQTSDNTAGNLLFQAAGGPPGLTAYMRALGDSVSRLDRIEPDLNSAIVADPRDTTSPRAIVDDLQKLFLGDALSPASRDRLVDWHLGTKTGANRIRAVLPATTKLAHKTGSGDNGATNDIGMTWTPGGTPILIAIYYTESTIPKLADREPVLAAAARIALGR